MAGQKTYSIVRYNLMNEKGYTPYCGNMTNCSFNPRTIWNGEQFYCPSCGWKSSFEPEFIQQYKKKWNL